MDQLFPANTDGLREGSPRCRGCGYSLVGLTEPRCPECGRRFDPAVPETYETRPPFLFWRYWLPAAAMTVTLGVAYGLFFSLAGGGIGWGLTLGVPLAMGCLLGYAVRLHWILILPCAGATLGVAAMLIGGMHPEAIFCILCVTGVFIVPVLVSIFFGWALRMILKRTRFSQSGYLPILFFFLLPLGVDQLERRFSSPPTDEMVRTQVDIAVPSDQAWNSLMFYEQVVHPPPFLLRIGLPKPVSTHGSMAAVGDMKVCVYEHGRLSKRMTAVVPGERLEFAVVQQQHVEDHAVQLKRGRFRFEAIDPHHTRIELTTEYTPLLTPRFAYGPVERLVVHTLHEHVIEGIRRKAVEDAAAMAKRAEEPGGLLR